MFPCPVRPGTGKKHAKLLANFKRRYRPYEALKMATYGNSQSIKMYRLRDPYPGEIGGVKEGTLANLMLVDGNPIKDISILTKPDENHALIMKDGKIYKNTVK